MRCDIRKKSARFSSDEIGIHRGEEPPGPRHRKEARECQELSGERIAELESRKRRSLNKRDGNALCPCLKRRCILEGRRYKTHRVRKLFCFLIDIYATNVLIEKRVKYWLFEYDIRELFYGTAGV